MSYSGHTRGSCQPGRCGGPSQLGPPIQGFLGRYSICPGWAAPIVRGPASARLAGLPSVARVLGSFCLVHLPSTTTFAPTRRLPAYTPRMPHPLLQLSQCVSIGTRSHMVTGRGSMDPHMRHVTHPCIPSWPHGLMPSYLPHPPSWPIFHQSINPSTITYHVTPCGHANIVLILAFLRIASLLYTSLHSPQPNYATWSKYLVLFIMLIVDARIINLRRTMSEDSLSWSGRPKS